MKYFKIHPDVACCAYKHGVLYDKEAVYPETQWDEGEALERVKRGFLIEVLPEPKIEPPIVDEPVTDETELDLDKDSKFRPKIGKK